MGIARVMSGPCARGPASSSGGMTQQSGPFGGEAGVPSTYCRLLKHFFIPGGDSAEVSRVGKASSSAMMIANISEHALRRILIPLGVGMIALATLARGPAQAQSEARTFIIGAGEGYGIVDCFVDGVTCGKTVANSWCEAHGHGPAIAFGRAADMTASIGQAAARIEKGAVIITCAK